MSKMLFGLKDIHTIVSNRRKFGGAIEAESIRLRTGEEYHHPVIVQVDVAQGQYLSISFIDNQGHNIMVHVNEIAKVFGLKHLLIHQLKNKYAKQMFIEEKSNYLKRLCAVNEGFLTKTFVEEATRLSLDIGQEELAKQQISLPFQTQGSVVPIHQKLFA